MRENCLVKRKKIISLQKMHVTKYHHVSRHKQGTQVNILHVLYHKWDKKPPTKVKVVY